MSKKVVLYASPHNPGATAVAADLAAGMEGVVVSSERPLSATHFLLYLNSQTYEGEPGERLADELRAARAAALTRQGIRPQMRSCAPVRMCSPEHGSVRAGREISGGCSTTFKIRVRLAPPQMAAVDLRQRGS